MGRSINLRPWGVCDRCGQRFRHSTLREEWTGILACKQCWEPKHPQLTPPQNVAGDPKPVENARPREAYTDAPAAFTADLTAVTADTTTLTADIE